MATTPIVLNNGQQVKMGRLPPRPNKAALHFADYYDQNKDALPPPAVVDYSAKAMAALQRMYRNDAEGCCVISGKKHQVGLWTANDSPDVIVADDSEVDADYVRICGPGDQGCVITDVLDDMMVMGQLLGGKRYKIDGYTKIDWTNKLEVQVAIEVFGSLSLGINLPQAWTCSGCVWDVTTSRIVGGHDVCVVGYNTKGVQICTWGSICTITWKAFLQTRWIEECYAQLSPEWYGKDNLAPNGIDAVTLKADLVSLAQGMIPNPYPVIPDPPLPPVIPPVIPPVVPPSGTAPPLLQISIPGVWSGTYRLV